MNYTEKINKFTEAVKDLLEVASGQEIIVILKTFLDEYGVGYDEEDPETIRDLEHQIDDLKDENAELKDVIKAVANNLDDAQSIISRNARRW